METKLLYMHDSYLFETTAKVVKLQKHEDGRDVVVLDQSIFYPQGGGQRFDTGKISNESTIFNVEEVRFVDGKTLHIGAYEKDKFNVGDQVTLRIDKELRVLHSKLQSSGHLIDIAIRNAGFSELKPIKGAHYPEWSQVEYKGVIPPEEIESAKDKIQAELDKMIDQGYVVQVETASREGVEEKCYILPPNIQDDKPTRIVAVWGDQYMPCGGTHVLDISELEGLKITKLKSKKGNTKVAYSVE